MQASLFNPLWYRVAELHPRLRTQVKIVRQRYRGQLWYVLQDPTSRRHHRINRAAYEFVGRLDGERSIQQVWDTLLESLPEQAPAQDEVIAILAQLYDAGLIQFESAPEVAEIFKHRDERERKQRLAAINPLAFRVPLFNPMRLLAKLEPWGKFLFSVPALMIWFVAVAVGLGLVASDWSTVRAHAAEHMLSTRYLLILWLCYPLIKAVHEFGHALAVRVWGGEVPEMGITLLALLPVPYVDASAASGFAHKHQRVIVGAIGIMVELFLAALATLIWFNVEPGLVRDCAFAIMFIGGVSTVLFNGNPLLRFDGYYVACDLLDLPNLSQRSNAFLAYLAQRYAFRVAKAVPPAQSTREKAWLLAYGLMAWPYRVFLSILILLWISGKSVIIALLLAGWMLVTMIIKPLVKLSQFLLWSPVLAAGRLRAAGVTCAGLGAIVVFVTLVPLPLATYAQGVVWLPENARLRAASDSFIDEVYVSDGARVQPGEPLVLLRDPLLRAELETLKAELAALDVEYQAALRTNAVRAERTREQMERLQLEIADAEHRSARLLIRSPMEGAFSMPKAQDLLDSYLPKGTIVAHLLPFNQSTARIVIRQQEEPLVRGQTRDIQVRISEAPGPSWQAKLLRGMPGATRELPSAALGDRAGGRITTDPTDSDGLRALEPVFNVDLDLPGNPAAYVGGRVVARLDHGYEPLIFRWQRALKGLLLKHVNAEQ